MFKSKFIEKDTIISLYPQNLILTETNDLSEIEFKFIEELGTSKIIKVQDKKDIKFYFFEKDGTNKILLHTKISYRAEENDSTLKYILKYYFEKKLSLKIISLNGDFAEDQTLYELPKEKFEIYLTDSFELIITAIIKE
ncbi:hypothetical protein [Fusobacterium ulcerans]|uniref:hypothetical protein n=1 Tax=Fusobacterium ulcerans TaxID=861 RepID=UPI0026DB30BB|nr:hypothetical protein [Fusobacterium ulcerans]